MNAIGIDVGGTNIKIGVVSKQGKVLKQDAFRVDPKEAGLTALKRIAKIINQYHKQYDIKGVGVGMPGILDLSTGELLYSSTTLNSWRHINIIKTLTKLTKLKVKISNDANVAALAEARFGKYKNVNSLILLTLGTGVGGGIIVNKHLVQGNNGQGAELGHMSIDYHGRKCGCGRIGCLEAYVSAKALKKDAAKAFKKEIPVKDIFALYEKGNPIAKKVINEYITYLGEGILNYCIIFRPEVILLSGGIAKSGTLLTKPLNTYLKKHHYGIKGTAKVLVDVASLQYDSGIIGAASLIL
ncbi:MAG: ROK family protein [Bacilli bacterium]|nr:ROK family protein [Bacilli bacterium]